MSGSPALVEGVRDSGAQVAWVTDPMHGNTITSSNGYETRWFEDILDEVVGFFEVHQALMDTIPAGLHMELTGDDVTEVLGGAGEIDEEGLTRRYETLVDDGEPRAVPRARLPRRGDALPPLSRSAAPRTGPPRTEPTRTGPTRTGPTGTVPTPSAHRAGTRGRGVGWSVEHAWRVGEAPLNDTCCWIPPGNHSPDASGT